MRMRVIYKNHKLNKVYGGVYNNYKFNLSKSFLHWGWASRVPGIWSAEGSDLLEKVELTLVGKAGWWKTWRKKAWWVGSRLQQDKSLLLCIRKLTTVDHSWLSG